MNSISDDMPVEFKTEAPCPSCGKDLYFIFYRTTISYENAIEIETYFCKNCLYKSTRTIPLDLLEEKKISFLVSKHDDLRTILYRSQEARLELPEFGITIDSGENSQGSITTVEGVLQDILDKLDLFVTPDDEYEKLDLLRGTIKGILAGDNHAFTIIVDDPLGKSKIASSRAVEEKHP
jgi:zinc finger protein